ncbi:MAG TPA: isochorismatase family cysteine hydrolase [Candidatus Angelobacter sp.]|jgi:nicotinamidase-related amidase
MEFVEGEQLLRQALPMEKNIAALKKRAISAQVPVIYVNDNVGHWRSDLKTQISHCLEDGVFGEPVARLLAPDRSDYFVLKPKSSAFFGTTLHTLLQHLEVETLVLTGMAADVCILFMATMPICAITKSLFHPTAWPQTHHAKLAWLWKT